MKFIISHKIFLFVITIMMVSLITFLSLGHVNNYIPNNIHEHEVYEDIDDDLYSYTLLITHGHSFKYSYNRSYIKDENKLCHHYGYDIKYEAVSLYNEYLNKGELLGTDSPNAFLHNENIERDKIKSLKRDKISNINNVCNLVPFLLILILLFLLSIIFTHVNVKNRMKYIMKHNNKVIMFTKIDFYYIGRSLKHAISRYNVNQIMHKYLFLVFPIIISVVGGSLGVSNVHNKIIYNMFYIIVRYLASLLSIMQFYRIITNYMYNTIHNRLFDRYVLHLNISNNASQYFQRLLKDSKKYDISHHYIRKIIGILRNNLRHCISHQNCK